MTREALVAELLEALKAMRAEVAALELDVVQLDLDAKRALIADPEGNADVVAMLVGDAQGRIAAARSTVAAHRAVLSHLAKGKAPGR
jgi:hypothetical protein